MIYVKQYGIQRSCTNIVKVVLEDCFEDTCVLTAALGDKHGPYPGTDNIDWSGKSWGKEYGKPVIRQFNKGDLRAIKDSHDSGSMRYVVCTKNPYAWYASYCKYKGVKIRRGVKQKHLREELRRWNNLYSSWMSLWRQKMFFVSVAHEDLLLRLDRVLDEVPNSLYLKKNKSGLKKLPDRQAPRGGQRLGLTGLTSKPFDKEYYDNRDYMNIYTASDLEIFKEELDPRLMENLRYDYDGGSR